MPKPKIQIENMQSIDVPHLDASKNIKEIVAPTGIKFIFEKHCFTITPTLEGLAVKKTVFGDTWDESILIYPEQTNKIIVK